MSLERFEVKGNIIHPIVAVGYVNFFLTLAVLILSTTIFARPSGVELDFPSLRQSMNPGGEPVVIAVTGENVIYVDGRVVTLNELRHFLAQGDFHRNTLMIKVSGQASMGRVADILDLCRNIAGVSVNVSTIL